MDRYKERQGRPTEGALRPEHERDNWHRCVAAIQANPAASQRDIARIANVGTALVVKVPRALKDDAAAA